MMSAQGGVCCALASLSICFYVSASGLTGESADRLLEKAAWLTEAHQANLAKQMSSRVKQAPPESLDFYPSWAP